MPADAGSGYAANLRRMEFGAEKIAQVSDRLVDAALLPCPRPGTDRPGLAHG